MPPSSFISTAIGLFFFLLLPFVSSFASYPLDERGYSVQTLAEYSLIGCTKVANNKKIPPTALFEFIQHEYYYGQLLSLLAMLKLVPQLQRGRLDYWSTLKRVIPYTNHMYDSATTMLACLSPFEGQNSTTPSCPFDPQVTMLIREREVVDKAKAELRRIQLVASLTRQLTADLSKKHRYETSEWEHIKGAFQTKMLYYRALLLDHSSKPSLKSVWDTVCNAPFEIGSVDPPSETSTPPVELSYEDIIDAFWETMIVLAHFRACILMFVLKEVLNLYHPQKCRMVRLYLNRIARRFMRSSAVC